MEVKLRDMQLRWAVRAIQNNTRVINNIYNKQTWGKRDSHDEAAHWLDEKDNGYSCSLLPNESTREALSFGDFEAGLRTTIYAYIEVVQLIQPGTERSKTLMNWISKLE